VDNEDGKDKWKESKATNGWNDLLMEDDDDDSGMDTESDSD
jgi:hypothetical protein